MTLSPEILTAIKAACAAKQKTIAEGIPMGVYSQGTTAGHPKHVVTVHHTSEKTADVEAAAQGHGAHKSVKTIGASKHEFSSLSSANKFHASCTKQGHTATVNSQNCSVDHLAVASYFKWLIDAPVSESSGELEEALSNPEFMREAVKTRESTALCLTLANKGQTIPVGLCIEAAAEAKAFGFIGGFQAVMEAMQAIQQVPSRFGYMALSILAENDQLKKNFLDLAMEGSTALFYFTKPTAADKLKTECERVLSPLGEVATLVSPGDVIGEGVTSDLFVFAVTPTEAQQESIIAALIDGLVEAAIADTFSDVSNESLAGLMNEAIQFLNQTPPNGEEIGAGSEIGGEEGDAHAEPDGDEDEDGEEPNGEEEDTSGAVKEESTMHEAVEVGHEVVQRDSGHAHTVEKINGKVAVLRNKVSGNTVTKNVDDLHKDLSTPGSAWHAPASKLKINFKTK
jgi:hypothetical protein